MPVRLPSDAEAPSPKSTVTLLIGLPPGATDVTTLRTVVPPTVGAAVVGVTAMVGAGLMQTATVPLTVAVTVAATFVFRVVDARPVASVVTCDIASVPSVVEKETGTPFERCPAASLTDAAIVTVPPVHGTMAGFAVTVTAADAAPPI